MEKKNLIGLKFGRWTVIASAETQNEHTYWRCRCECGNERNVESYSLQNNGTFSCGCYKTETLRYRSFWSNPSFYSIYHNIKTRCYNKNSIAYHNYGGRGIVMCDEWKNNPISFDNWAKNSGYKKSLTIDRIDNNGNYEPDNCRWVSRKIQNLNRRDNVNISYLGNPITVDELSKISGESDKVIYEWIQKGVLEKKLSTGSRTKRKYTIDGTTKTLNEWVEISGNSRRLIQGRISNGWSVKSAILNPKMRKGNLC